MRAVHHIELWTESLAKTEGSFQWLLTSLGWRLERNEEWPTGRIWHAPGGEYLVLEESPSASGRHDRMRAGLNHLALCAEGRAALDALRAAAADHGWHELFGDRYPHAGGEGHVALFLENDEGFEVEVVCG